MYLSSTRAENHCMWTIDMAYLPNIYKKRYESLREGQRAKLKRKAQPVLRLVRGNKCTNRWRAAKSQNWVKILILRWGSYWAAKMFLIHIYYLNLGKNNIAGGVMAVNRSYLTAFWQISNNASYPIWDAIKTQYNDYEVIYGCVYEWYI